MNNLRNPEIGKDYSYSEVASFYEHDPNWIHYVITRGTAVLALRLRFDYNLKIGYQPAEVWVGDTPQVREWGQRLAGQKKPVDLFVKGFKKNTYTFKGRFNVSNRQATAGHLNRVRENVPHDQGISRVVYLEPI